MSQYSELLRAIADGKRLETAYAGAWHPMTEKAAFERMARGDNIEWREAPKMVRQVACDAPVPMSRAPLLNQVYFTPFLLRSSKYLALTWAGDDEDLFLLERGLCYASEKDAIARADAMLQIESV